MIEQKKMDFFEKNLRAECCRVSFLGPRSDWVKVLAMRLGVRYLGLEETLTKHRASGQVSYSLAAELSKALGITSDRLVYDHHQEDMRHYWCKATMKIALDNEVKETEILELKSMLNEVKKSLPKQDYENAKQRALKKTIPA